MAHPMTKRRYPPPRQESPQAPPWRCKGCRYIVSEGTRPYCRLCRGKGLGAQEESGGRA
jgi:hypothetical protein